MTPEQIHAAAERTRMAIDAPRVRPTTEIADAFTLADAYLTLRPAFDEAVKLLERFESVGYFEAPSVELRRETVLFLNKWKGKE